MWEIHDLKVLQQLSAAEDAAADAQNNFQHLSIIPLSHLTHEDPDKNFHTVMCGMWEPLWVSGFPLKELLWSPIIHILSYMAEFAQEHRQVLVLDENQTSFVHAAGYTWTDWWYWLMCSQIRCCS